MTPAASTPPPLLRNGPPPPPGEEWQSPPERLGQPDEHPAPRAILRRADAHTGAVADLIFMVGEVDHIDPHVEVRPREMVARGQVDLRIAGEMPAIGDRRPVGQH